MNESLISEDWAIAFARKKQCHPSHNQTNSFAAQLAAAPGAPHSTALSLGRTPHRHRGPAHSSERSTKKISPTSAKPASPLASL